ncbi:SnoaL-like domain-containing protein [Dyella sp. OK004]|uniref:nuclear transport factor 2 family protein n=1 Tax=Dyella sp. OK004 TaxID=1855292 RepID=UPI0008EE5D32|nr:nuclear transport factor 2 family protein [Dyella sp. OK004]SFR88458.1 SnoaL-like domain-containing protein [Dyella sp. OK004]
MKTIIASALILASFFGGIAHAADPSDDIHRLIDGFQKAIVAKDGKALSDMFLPSGGAWVTVLSDDSYARMKAKSPNVPRYKLGNYADFVQFVATSKVPIEERFNQVRVETDGAVASVYFDFVFLQDGKENNRGSETWHVVKTDDGWKISSMTYSVNMPAKR